MISHTAFIDFIPSTQNATLPINETASTTCVMFEVLDDYLALEGEEGFGVRLTLPAATDRISLEVQTQEAMVVISDDNSECTLYSCTFIFIMLSTSLQTKLVN